MPKSYDPMTELRKRVSGRRQKEFALSVPCSQGHVSDMLNGHKKISDAVIEALGLERVITYRKKKEAKE